MEDTDGTVKNGRLANFGPRDGEDVTDEHVFEVFGLAGGFAHEEDGGPGSYRVSDADESFLRNVAAPCARKRENGSAEKGEAEADPVGAAAVRVHPDENSHRGTQRGDLCESEIHEDDAALDNMHAEIGVNAGENQARNKRC